MELPQAPRLLLDHKACVLHSVLYGPLCISSLLRVAHRVADHSYVLSMQSIESWMWPCIQRLVLETKASKSEANAAGSSSLLHRSGT